MINKLTITGWLKYVVFVYVLIALVVSILTGFEVISKHERNLAALALFGSYMFLSVCNAIYDKWFKW